MKCFLVNKRMSRTDSRIPVSVEYDIGGNTKVLPPDSRTEVPFHEAQVCLSRNQTDGVTVEYEKD